MLKESHPVASRSGRIGGIAECFARLLSILLYVVSLTLPGMTTDPVETDFASGLSLLVLGWLGLVRGVFAWLANPALWIAWLTMTRSDRVSRGVALAASTLACAFALSLLLYEEVPQASSSGAACNIVHFGLSYWFWIASTACAWLGSIAAIFRRVLPREIESPT